MVPPTTTGRDQLLSQLSWRKAVMAFIVNKKMWARMKDVKCIILWLIASPWQVDTSYVQFLYTDFLFLTNVYLPVWFIFSVIPTWNSKMRLQHTLLTLPRDITLQVMRCSSFCEFYMNLVCKCDTVILCYKPLPPQLPSYLIIYAAWKWLKSCTLLENQSYLFQCET